jgi:hypothetical protein
MPLHTEIELPPPSALSLMNSEFTMLSFGDLLQSIMERLLPCDLV